MTSSTTGGVGPAGGHETRNALNLLKSSVLYIEVERFGRSIKLHKNHNKLMNIRIFIDIGKIGSRRNQFEHSIERVSKSDRM